MFGIGAPELVLILVLALIFIGPAKLPDMARVIGSTFREFGRTLDGVKEELISTGDSIREGAEFAEKGPIPPPSPHLGETSQEIKKDSGIPVPAEVGDRSGRP